MAVIKSKGNGYALYNGVKLPNIESVWTDKEKYPYAYIAGSDGIYSLVVSKQMATYDGNDEITIHSPFSVINWFYGPELGLSSWGEETASEDTGGGYAVASAYMPLTWAPHDIPNTYGTTYLDASDPIPLDGMNVIEWDGVTDGLVSVSDVFYKLSDLHLTKNELVGGAYVSYIPAPIAVTLTEEDIICLDSYPGVILIASDFCLVITQENAALEDFVFPEVGIYGQLYPLLLAYTPSSTEPEEPEKPTTDSSIDPTSMLMGWLVGRAVASQRGKVTPSEPDVPVVPDEPEKQLIGYSYNGVVLPDINEVWTDKKTYPYACIFNLTEDAPSYGLMISSTTVTAWMTNNPNEGDTDVYLNQAADFMIYIYSTEANGWTYVSAESGFTGFGYMGTIPCWSSYDILWHESQQEYLGTVAIAASDPIPVYE